MSDAFVLAATQFELRGVVDPNRGSVADVCWPAEVSNNELPSKTDHDKAATSVRVLAAVLTHSLHSPPVPLGACENGRGIDPHHMLTTPNVHVAEHDPWVELGAR